MGHVLGPESVSVGLQRPVERFGDILYKRVVSVGTVVVQGEK